MRVRKFSSVINFDDFYRVSSSGPRVRTQSQFLKLAVRVRNKFVDEVSFSQYQYSISIVMELGIIV